MYYLKKIIILLKELPNPSLFLYHFHHYINKVVSTNIAKKIAMRNMEEYKTEGVDDLIVSTIDGSNQVVHPDIDTYKDKIVLICTPYPYGMEEYENPCLYIGPDIRSLESIKSPIDTQVIHKQGVHMSDPCVIINGNKALCIYRETIYKDDYIYLKVLLIDEKGGNRFEERRPLLSKKGSYILSPAGVIAQDDLWIFHVESNNMESQLFLSRFDTSNYSLNSTSLVSVVNEPNGYYLWHIGIVNSTSYKKIISLGESLLGLFLYKSKSAPSDMKLYLAQFNCKTEQWCILKEISIPYSIIPFLSFPYKSCFNPQNKSLILSFRDKKRRYRLVEIDLQEC